MVRPRYMVWENVPGAFSSGSPKGADFAAVIEEIIKVAEPGTSVSVCVPNGGWTKSGCYYAENGSWSIAWRVHDAQFWGVPQRRKRISLVADFGGLSAPEILFERKGLSRDSEPCGEAGEDTAGAAGGGVEGAGKCLNPWEIQQQRIQPIDGTAASISAAEKRYGGIQSLIFDTAGAAGGGVEGAGGCLTGWDVQSKRIFNPDGKSGTLNSGTTEGMNIVPSVLQTREPILLESNQNHATVQTDGISTALPASMGMGGGYVPMVTAYGISSYDRNAMKSSNPHSGIYEADTARTLDLNGGSPACNQGGIAVVQSGSVIGVSEDVTGAHPAEEHGHQPLVVSNEGDIAGTLDASYYKGTGARNGKERTVVCVGNGQLNQMSMAEQANTLDTMHDQQAVMVAAVDCRNGTENTDTNGTLQAKENGGQSLNYQNTVRCGAIVRRLTPLECERLQGYPDGWTNIGEWVDSKGKKHKDADSPCYKALGNSIALPFWQWMARRICAQYERTVTMASLFDGIGGFPLVFQRCGAVPVWASEIEEFPIAVTKVRFPEDESV